MHLSRYITHWGQQRADEPALVFEGQSLTWGELDAQANAVAAHFQGLDVGPGDRIGCLLGNSLEWCVAFAASIKLGAILIPLNPMFGPFELRQIAEDSDCSAVVSTPALIVKLPVPAGGAGEGTDVLIYDWKGGRAPEAFSSVLARGGAVEKTRQTDDDVLVVSYTSVQSIRSGRWV